MNQVERDLTYRLNALKAGCDQYGWDSEWCKTSTQIWEDQHKMNVVMEKYGDYAVIFLIVLVVLLIPFLLGWKLTNKETPHSK